MYVYVLKDIHVSVMTSVTVNVHKKIMAVASMLYSMAVIVTYSVVWVYGEINNYSWDYGSYINETVPFEMK